MRKIILAFALIFTATFAYAEKIPRPLSTDERVRQIAYDPNQVFEIVGNYGYQITIELASDERISIHTIGDSIAWQSVIHNNRIFLKPVEPDATTNLTVVTNKRTYLFKLSSSSKHDDATFLVRFIYPSTTVADQTPGGDFQSHPFDRITSLSPSKRNMNYSSAGDKQSIALQGVFDDGEFTYFLFENGVEIPAFYLVGNDGTESIVNTRREGDYVVVERTGRMFTLRNGESHLCVKNALQASTEAGA